MVLCETGNLIWLSFLFTSTGIVKFDLFSLKRVQCVLSFIYIRTMGNIIRIWAGTCGFAIVILVDGLKEYVVPRCKMNR